MTIRIVIPVRDPTEGKSRLSEILSAPEREKFNRDCFRYVLDLACRFGPSEACFVISRSAWVLQAAREAGAQPIAEIGKGLNAALEQASQNRDDAGPLLTLSTDLPLLKLDDIAALAAALDRADVIAACDVTGHGTNALLMRRPRLIPYLYGPGSLVAHRQAAEQQGHAFAVIRRPGLQRDVDTPGDFEAVGARAREAMPVPGGRGTLPGSSPSPGGYLGRHSRHP